MEKVLNSLLNNLQSCLDKTRIQKQGTSKRRNNDFNRLKVTLSIIPEEQT